MLETQKLHTDDLTKNDLQISFGMTLDRFLALKKTVTRRYWSSRYATRLRLCKTPIYATSNWRNGDIVGTVQIISIKNDNLEEITQEEVILEGYPEYTPEEFLDAFFSDRKAKNKPGYSYYRIEFEPILYEGKYKPLQEKKPPIESVTKFDFRHQQLISWRSFFIAFDLSQQKEEITEYQIIVECANRGGAIQLVKSWLKTFDIEWSPYLLYLN